MSDAGIRRPCKSCGKNLWIVMGPNGKAIPLDTDAPVYTVEGDQRGMRAVRVNSYVSHFLTCSDPNRFSKNKEPQQQSLLLQGKAL